MQQERPLERGRRTLERLAEHRHENAPAREAGERIAQPLCPCQRVVLVAALLEAGRGREVVVGAHRHDQEVGVVGADVGSHPSRRRVDANHRLLAKFDALLGDLAVGQSHLIRRLPAQHHLELREAEKNESLRSIKVTSTASEAVSDRRVASSSPPKPAPRITTCRFTDAILLGALQSAIGPVGVLAELTGSDEQPVCDPDPEEATDHEEQSDDIES